MLSIDTLKRFSNAVIPPDADSVFKSLFTLLNSERPGLKSLAQFDEVIQYGGKAGQSLFAHIMDMIYVLATIQKIIALESDDELRVLLTAIILHDLNKLEEEKRSFGELSRAENVRMVLEDYGLAEFFSNWEPYIDDIALLIQSHGGHSSQSGGRLIRRVNEPRYTLDMRRLDALIYLIRALDTVSLSHTITEKAHKTTFVDNLNAYLNESGRDVQYTINTHQLVEQRGLLTNMLHNALTRGLQTDAGWYPVLLYPDGVAYLVQKGSADIAGNGDTLAERLSKYVKELLDSAQFEDAGTLLEQGPQGIKFKPDAWLSGLPPQALWAAVRALVARRKFKREELEQKSRERAATNLPTLRIKNPARAAALDAALNSPDPLITGTDDQMRAAELLRTYYIALATYAPALADPWTALYGLAELPADRYPLYDAFDARYDRPYILARDLTLSPEQIFSRIVEDTPDRLPIQEAGNGESDPLWADYLRLYLIVGERPLTSEGWMLHSAHYIAHNHEQCPQCSAPFKTQPWVAADVRGEDLKVQAFSNRLGAGGAEPKKNICPICRMQFLLEKLNYPNVKGESPLYVHFFPYSFVTPPFQKGLSAEFARIKNSDEAVAALNLGDLNKAIHDLAAKHRIRPVYSTQTKAGKPHPYGIYAPSFADSFAGMITMPLNPAGDNATERYLYALWTALLWGRAFDMKLLLGKSAVPPLPPDALPDVFLDMVPVAVEGLIHRQDYHWYEGKTQTDGTLVELLKAITDLFAVKPMVGDARDQESTLVTLVRAMAESPLGVFHAADRLMERHDREVWDGRRAFPHLKTLATYVADHTGVFAMKKLDEVLDQMSQLAWTARLRGRTLNRSGLLYPLTEIFDHLMQISDAFGKEPMKAATKRDVFDHLARISEEKRGKKTTKAVNEFVDLWYDGVVEGVYGGNVRRVLQDEKLLKSAYLFYVQSKIPRKDKAEQPETEPTEV